ncbi:MAG: hypothetical protein ACSHX0_06815 [Akkermansiaceae bacterium]
MNIEQLSKKYGISQRSVKNWEARGVEHGVPVPWDDPDGLLVWYRNIHGREPNRKFMAAIEALQLAEKSTVEDGESPVGGKADDSDGGAKAIEAAERLMDNQIFERLCESLGLSKTLAHVVEEERICYEEYEEAKASKSTNISLKRKNWREAAEMKRALQRSDDAVEIALKMLKQWTRGEWEPRWKKIRVQMSGNKLGVNLRDKLLAAESEADWVKVWDDGFEAVLAECGD